MVVVSEYALHPVHGSIQPNRILREAGLLNVKDKEIDYESSAAFAMVDHQIGYLFSHDPSALRVLMDAGIERVPDAICPKHRRAGEACIQAPEGLWLDYRWWSDPADAPAFATTVDIHRKPGYDPLELFADFKTRQTATDAAMINGSHGRIHESEGIAIGFSSESTGAANLAPLILRKLAASA